MRMIGPWYFLVALFVLTLQFATPARADTYQIIPLSSDQGYFFYGMDDSGLVVINESSYCASACYETYLNGVRTGNAVPLPIFAADDGSPCSPAVPDGASVIYATCNNGSDVWTGTLTSSQVYPSIYTGLDTPLVGSGQNGGNDFIYMNALGDIVFDDIFNEEFYEGIDQTTLTPEPSSLVLFATGILTLGFLIRRRKQLA